MSAPLGIALEPVALRRSPCPWSFYGRLVVAAWFATGLWVMVAVPEFLRPWTAATSIVGLWWAVWCALVRLLGGR